MAKLGLSCSTSKLALVELFQNLRKRSTATDDGKTARWKIVELLVERNDSAATTLLLMASAVEDVHKVPPSAAGCSLTCKQ